MNGYDVQQLDRFRNVTLVGTGITMETKGESIVLWIGRSKPRKIGHFKNLDEAVAYVHGFELGFEKGYAWSKRKDRK